MSKEYPPKDGDEIANPNHTEGASAPILGGGGVAGGGSISKNPNVRRENESFEQMHERRIDEGETKRGKWVELINREVKEQEENPNALKETKDKTPVQEKSVDKDAKEAR